MVFYKMSVVGSLTCCLPIPVYQYFLYLYTSASYTCIPVLPLPVYQYFLYLYTNASFTCIPVQESLPPEHGGELFRNALEDLLDGGGVADEGGGHGDARGSHVADCNL